MRLQLARPESRFLGPDLYNQIFTLHGTTMMFLFAVPIMQGLGVYLVPLMVGTRNIAFARLVAFSYYLFLVGGIMLYVAFLLNIGPDAGWFSYVPLAGPEYGPGKQADFWAQMITFTELSSLSIAVALIVTIFQLRAPGMSLNRLPLFVWSILVMSMMVIFAMPSVMLASTMLLMDRLVGTHFFNPAEGGDALLWQHLFWFFGHPEVYIIFIPGLGIVSSIIVTFSRRQMFGYTAIVLSLVSTAFMGFGLWVHHMFATDVLQLGQSFFTAASMMIAIPSGVQIFCWSATLWAGRPRLQTPLLFVIGVFLRVRTRRPHRCHVSRRATRLAGSRHVFRRRALPLCLDWRGCFPAVRRLVLLVSEDHWTHAQRARRDMELLAALRRLQSHLFPDASTRARRHATSSLHVPGRDGVGPPQFTGQPGGSASYPQRCGVHRQRAMDSPSGLSRGR
jgi:hypothetical protein